MVETHQPTRPRPRFAADCTAFVAKRLRIERARTIGGTRFPLPFGIGGQSRSTEGTSRPTRPVRPSSRHLCRRAAGFLVYQRAARQTARIQSAPFFQTAKLLGLRILSFPSTNSPTISSWRVNTTAETKCKNLHGLNPKDTLTDKAAKLVQQSQLLHTPQGKATLTAQGLPENLLPASIVRGIGFFPQGFHAFEPPLNPYGWRGVYIQDWTEYGFERQEARYHLLDRMAYLAPARVAETETLNETEIRRIDQG